MLNPVVTLKRTVMSKIPCVNHQSGIQSTSHIEIYFLTAQIGSSFIHLIRTDSNEFFLMAE